MILENKNILITGCGGMLGQAVYYTFKNKNTILATDIVINEDWLSFLDVRDLDSVKSVCKTFKPDLIINLAAITDVEFCESNPGEAYKTNGLGHENICRAAAVNETPVVYISTAGVFDGLKEFYTDVDKPNPISEYGKSKHYGEEITARLLKKYFIFRAGWMMGGGDKDKKFIKKLYDKLAKGEKEIYVVDDKFGSPTYTWDFARSMMKIIATDKWGLYNMVCEGSGNRVDIASEFIKLMNMNDHVKITVVSSDYFKSEYFAPRPKSETLQNIKLKELNFMFMRDWKVCLKEYSEEFKPIDNKIPSND